MNIQQVEFSQKNYLMIKKAINTDQITDKEMYGAAFGRLYGFLEKHQIKPTGPAAVLYFKWDESNKSAEIGIAVPVLGIESINDAELLVYDVPASKAILGVLRGDYSGLAEVHRALMDYMNEHKLNSLNLAIEEYAIMPGTDPKDNVTNVYYFYK